MHWINKCLKLLIIGCKSIAVKQISVSCCIGQLSIIVRNNQNKRQRWKSFKQGFVWALIFRALISCFHCFGSELILSIMAEMNNEENHLKLSSFKTNWKARRPRRRWIPQSLPSTMLLMHKDPSLSPTSWKCSIEPPWGLDIYHMGLWGTFKMRYAEPIWTHVGSMT